MVICPFISGHPSSLLRFEYIAMTVGGGYDERAIQG